MVIKRILCAALLLAGLMSSAEVNAQTTRWTGTDINTLNDGDVVFFYNVGTGRFLIHGGDWGTQVRLFNEDWGRAFTYRKSVSYRSGYQTYTKSGNFFDTGVLTDGDAKYLGCNVPLLTSQHDWTGNDDAETWTLLMDARVFSGYHAASTSSGRPGWTFTPVDEGDGTFTYYMSEHLTYQNVDSTCYLGVAYGENWKGHEGDPGGNLALLSSSFDKAVWSTANPTQSVNYVNGVKNAVLEGLEAGTTSVTRNMGTEVPIFNVDTKIPLRDLYKWRIVTRAQIEATIGAMDAGDGLSVNLSYLITDPGFERNDQNFFNTTTNGWNTGRVSGVTYSNSQYRYGYTWGWSSQGTNQQNSPRKSEAWNAPVRLKTQWNDKAKAKSGFMEFEGAGTVSSYIEAPATGWYRVSVYGFYSGSNEAYLFATTTNPQGTSAVNTSGFTKSALYKENSSPFLNADKETEDQVLAAGGVFINNYADKQQYYREVDIYVTGGTRIYFGVGKNGATKSSRDDYDSWGDEYFHDTDWVGVDQFSINYLGNDIVVFDEDEESLNYLKEENGEDKQYNNQTVRLKRTMVTGAWNSFVFPLDLTAVQVRAAFGNNTRLAKLNTLGRAEDPQQSPYYIDFVTIPLPAEGTALNAGEFYLIQPEYNPTVGTDYSYYTMGRSTFNTGDFTATAETVINIAEGMTHENKAKSKGTYVRTKNYDSFDKDNPTEPYVPKSYEQDGVIYGSYVLGKASADATTTDMYRLKNNMRIKGFRGWIEDVPLGASAKVIFNGVFDDDEITNIEGTIVTPSRITDNRIYSISGQLVNCDENALNTLPKGMYIMNGKKFVIK